LLTAGDWRVLALEPGRAVRAQKAVRAAVAKVPRPALVVSDPELRVHVYDLVAYDVSSIPVLSAKEVLDEIPILSDQIELT
jgi:flagellar biosynthesis component FlhA